MIYPKAVSDAWAEHRRQINVKCEGAWKELTEKVTVRQKDICKKHGLTSTQFTKWIACYHRGDLAVIRAKAGYRLNGPR